MHNIKDIKKNIEAFNKALKDRFLNVDLKNILSLDEENRKLIQEKEILEKEKKRYFQVKRYKTIQKIKTFIRKN